MPVGAKYVNSVLGFLFFTAIVIAAGSSLFYLWRLGDLQLSIIVLVIIAMLWLLRRKISSPLKIRGVRGVMNEAPNKNHNPLRLSLILRERDAMYKLAMTTIFLVLILFGFKLLLNSATAVSIRSPWEVVPVGFLAVFFLALIVWLLIINKDQQNSSRPFFLMSLLLFLGFAVAVVVYKIGFGFDPFIHEASQKLIFETGTLNPKPLRYIGHYSLVIFLAKILSVNLVVINKILLPFLASLILPVFAFVSLGKLIPEKINRYAPVLLLVIPFSNLAFSVPFSLGLFFLLLTALSVVDENSGRLPLLLSLIALLVHPLAGLPALILVGWQYVLRKKTQLIPERTPNSIRGQSKDKILKTLRQAQGIKYALLTITSILIIPLTFIILNSTSSLFQSSIASESILDQIDFSLATWVPFYSPYHLVYLFEKSLPLIALILIAIGLKYLWQTKKNTHLALVISAVLLLGSFFVSSYINFSSIISYERPEFILRFITIITVILLPIIAIGASRVIYNLKNIKHGQIALYFFLPLVLTISLYLSYPRVDAFTKSRAFSTSASDLLAVQWIEQDAQGQEYIVLANQAVSAAALQEFGFRKYYDACPSRDSRSAVPTEQTNDNCQQLFYYPIPTSSPLYETYLRLVYVNPTRQRIKTAMNLTDVNLAYFVINDYWLDFEKIVAAAKLETNEFTAINDGKIYIFKYSNLTK